MQWSNSLDWFYWGILCHKRMRRAWELLEGADQPTRGRHHAGGGLHATRPRKRQASSLPRHHAGRGLHATRTRERQASGISRHHAGGGLHARRPRKRRTSGLSRRRRAPHGAAEERPSAKSTDQEGAVECLVSLFLAGVITPQTYVNGLSPRRDPAYTGRHPTSLQAKEHPSRTRHGRGRRAATPTKDSPSSTQHGRAAPQAKDSPSSTQHGRTAPQSKDSPKPATVGVSPDSLDHWVIPARMADGCATRPPQPCGP